MDSFFNYDFFLNDNENSVNQSAFVPYTNEFSQESTLNTPEKNMKNRMVEFLKKKNPAPPPPPPPPPPPSAVMITPIESERERNQKHVMNERMRREKEKHNYQELHKLLPRGTKKDKKSIVQMAAREIEELKSYKGKLETKNKELRKLAIGGNEENRNAVKIKIRVENPASGIDSMLEVLKCLKSKPSSSVVAQSIQSSFSAMEFSSVLQIHTSVEAAEVENAVQRTLYEVERKFQCPNFNLAQHISASARFHDHYNAIK